MKKAIILLTLILVFAFIPACGNEPELPTQEAPAIPEVQETPTPEPEIETVTATEEAEEVDELSMLRDILGVEFTIEPWEYALYTWEQPWYEGDRIYRWQFLELSEPLNLNNFPTTGDYPFRMYGGLFQTVLGDVLITTHHNGNQYLYIHTATSPERGVPWYHIVSIDGIELNPEETFNWDWQRREAQERRGKPLWITEPSFRNNDAVGTRVKTNSAMFDAIDRFWIDNEGSIQNTYQPAWFDTGERYIIDEDLSDEFREILSQAWSKESLATVMPFNQDFFDEIISGVEFYFARGGGGHYWSSPTMSQISNNPDWREWFVYTAIHELGHALGLGEALTDMFSRELMEANQNFIILQMYCALGIYDQALLRLMEKQGRGDLFWEAVFHSEAKYEQLWDMYMSEYVSFKDLQIIRGVDAVVNNWAGMYLSGSAAAFRAWSSGYHHDHAQNELLRIWGRLHSDTYLSTSGRISALSEFHEWVNIFVSFADGHGIQPFHSHLDHAIANHHTRHGNRLA